MKKLVLVLVILLAITATSSAEQKLKPVVYLGGGIAMPMGPELFKDYWKMGIGFGGGLGFQLNPNMELIASVYYNQFGLDDDKLLTDLDAPDDVTIDGAEFKAIEILADFKYMFSSGQGASKLKPFIIGGLGFGNIKFADATVTGDDEEVELPFGDISETKVMFGFGAGLDYMISPKAAIWFQGRFNMISTEGESTTYLPIRAGVKFLLGSDTE